MKRNWKCKVGLHDWEQTACWTEDEVNNYARDEVYGKAPIIALDCGLVRAFDQKVCLRCGKYVDNITPAKTRAIQKLVGEKMRSDRARRLLNDQTNS
jgi:hypothetical protein